MKKQIVSLLILSSVFVLTGCSETQWSWWETENLSIERAIPLDDAKNALDSSLSNIKTIKAIKRSHTEETYYKNYLGKYTTEDDSNISLSETTNTNVYDNYTLVSETNQTEDKSFLHASTSSKSQIIIYQFAESKNSDINYRYSYDFGYAEKEVAEAEPHKFVGEDDFNAQFVIGPNYNSSILTSTTSSTYGFAKNNEIIVETMRTETNEKYTVKFNGREFPKVKNIYTLYRLCPIETDAEGNSKYVIDYYKQSTQILIGYDIFGEALKEPFMLEKDETVEAYYRSSNGTYDLTTIPAVTTK